MNTINFQVNWVIVQKLTLVKVVMQGMGCSRGNIYNVGAEVNIEMPGSKKSSAMSGNLDL